MAKEKKAAESKFTKEQLLTATKFANRRDLLEAVLEADKTYTIDEAEQKMKEFLERKVD